jgi:hypothetical protein
MEIIESTTMKHGGEYSPKWRIETRMSNIVDSEYEE